MIFSDSLGSNFVVVVVFVVSLDETYLIVSVSFIVS